MKKSIKIIAVIAIIAILVASVFVAFEVSHDCTGEDCPVCSVINTLKHLCETLLILTVSVTAAGKLSDKKAAAADEKEFHAHTPVMLKVKLSD